MFSMLSIFVFLLTKCFCGPVIEAGSESESFIDAHIWNDPDLQDLETCVTKVLDDDDDTGKNWNELEMDVLSLSSQNKGQYSTVGSSARLWPNNAVPTKLQPGMTTKELKKLACAVKFFTEKTCIKFIQARSDHTDYLLITKNDPRKRCFSGELGREGGEQIVNLEEYNSHCWTHGTIIHELMHVIGFFHEQSREDRDQFIEVLMNNIPAKYHRQFAKASELGMSQKLIGTYDYASVMHYSRFLKGSSNPMMTAKKDPIDQNNKRMGNRKAPTAEDVNKINLLYSCPAFSKCDTCAKEKICCGDICCEKGSTCCKDKCCPSGSVCCGDVCCPSGSSCLSGPNIHGCKSDLLVLIGGSYNKSAIQYYYPNHPEQNRVSTTKLLHGRYNIFGSIANGNIIYGGGYDSENVALKTTEIFSVSTEKISQGPVMNEARISASSAVLNGVLYVCGGIFNSYTCEKLELKSLMEWKFSPGPSEPRGGHAMVTVGQYIYSIGGRGYYTADGGKEHMYRKTVERFDPCSEKWSLVSPMNYAREALAATVLHGYIYACGGWGDGSESCERYSPIEDKWEMIASMTRERYQFALLPYKNSLCALGFGRGVEVYDVASDKWTRTDDLPLRISDSAAAVVA